jgi:hypothetical protein
MPQFAFNTRYVTESKANIAKQVYAADRSTRLDVYCDNPECNEHIPGEPLATVTVCMVDYGETPGDGMVFIKDYAENEGTVEALHEAGIIGQPERWIDAGYAKDGVAECKLLVEV